MKLLVVDNDRYWVEMLVGWLKTMGYEVSRAYTGKQMRLEWLQQQPDLVLVDSQLPDIDVLEMFRELRIQHDALVLIMSEGKEIEEEVRYLQSGADDYLRKPFFPGQLLARISALTRRGRSTLKIRPFSVITRGPLQIDSLHNTVSIYGKSAYLTPTESKILYLLAANINQVCTAEQIVTYVWGYHGDGDVSLIKAHIRHLRKKVEADPGNPRFILTVTGVGYKLVHAPAQEFAS